MSQFANAFASIVSTVVKKLAISIFVLAKASELMYLTQLPNVTWPVKFLLSTNALSATPAI